MDLNLVRALFVFLLTFACCLLEPFGLGHFSAAAVGALGALAVIVFELRVRAMSLGRLIGAVAGSVMGILSAFLISLVLRSSLPLGATEDWLQIFVLMLMAYVGLVVGTSKGDLLNLAALGDLFNKERSVKRTMKLLDTSAIIDGRIADMAETGFLDGPLLVPGFVLEELQLVADSTDGGKRQRGRRGLDVLQRMQQNPVLGIQILEEDVPGVRAVDLKLIELGKKHDAKIVTNDFNLNKVAQLHGVKVLNINDLANALKPVVLPGEKMNLYILKEGKEYNQGIGYLDDGTMVVVDNARKMIGKCIEVSVTSVLQTASGKMIFGKSEGANNGRVEDPAPHVEHLRVSEVGQARPITE